MSLKPGAEPARRGQVRAAAQIDEAALAVQRDRLAGRDAADDLGLVALALLQEELDGGVAIPDLAHDLLVARDDFVHALLDALEILRRERRAAREVVVEAVLDGRADRHLRLGIELLDGLGHDVRRVVAQQLEPVGRRPRHDLDRVRRARSAASGLSAHRRSARRPRRARGASRCCARWLRRRRVREMNAAIRRVR